MDRPYLATVSAAAAFYMMYDALISFRIWEDIGEGPFYVLATIFTIGLVVAGASTVWLASKAVLAKGAN